MVASDEHAASTGGAPSHQGVSVGSIPAPSAPAGRRDPSPISVAAAGQGNGPSRISANGLPSGFR